jgi:hypothetical protein
MNSATPDAPIIDTLAAAQTGSLASQPTTPEETQKKSKESTTKTPSDTKGLNLHGMSEDEMQALIDAVVKKQRDNSTEKGGSNTDDGKKRQENSTEKAQGRDDSTNGEDNSESDHNTTGKKTTKRQRDKRVAFEQDTDMNVDDEKHDSSSSSSSAMNRNAKMDSQDSQDVKRRKLEQGKLAIKSAQEILQEIEDLVGVDPAIYLEEQKKKLAHEYFEEQKGVMDAVLDMFGVETPEELQPLVKKELKEAYSTPTKFKESGLVMAAKASRGNRNGTSHSGAESAYRFLKGDGHTNRNSMSLTDFQPKMNTGNLRLNGYYVPERFDELASTYKKKSESRRPEPPQTYQDEMDVDTERSYPNSSQRQGSRYTDSQQYRPQQQAPSENASHMNASRNSAANSHVGIPSYDSAQIEDPMAKEIRGALATIKSFAAQQQRDTPNAVYITENRQEIDRLQRSHGEIFTQGFGSLYGNNILKRAMTKRGVSDEELEDQREIHHHVLKVGLDNFLTGGSPLSQEDRIALNSRMNFDTYTGEAKGFVPILADGREYV